MKKLSTLLLIAAVAAGIDANSAEVTRIAAGNHTMLLTKDGKIYVSGNNDAGQLGDGHYFDSEISDNHYNATTFKPVEKDGVKFRSVTATLYNSYAIASDGALYAWGQNAYGQLGLVSVGTYSGIYTPTKVDDAKWAVVKGRSTTIVGIHTDGTLWAWGKNLTGQLGVGADSEMKECAMAPEKVSDERWLDCASGFYHSTAVKADGTLWAWGDNSQNQVNSSSTTIFTTPQQVGEDTDWTQVQAGLKMSAALKADGTLWTWGNNEESALGRAVEGKTDGKPMKAFDYRNDKLYWFGSSVDNTMRLYEIDTATAKATAVSGNSQAQFLGIYFENPVNAAPDCVTDLAYTSTGARREGTLSFRMPEKTFGGAALEGTLNVRIAIEGVDTVTISGKNPGELVSLPLTLPDGTARIVVTADNAKGYGLQSRVKTQVGVDQPMPAENVSLRVDGGEATLSWTAPTAGKNGGYVGNLTYRVERNDGVVVAEATTETSLTGLQKGKYSLTEYKVTAANESGAASAATSNSVILGDALAMPFKESFDGGTCQHTWFMGAAWDTFTAGNDPKTQDADGTSGLISFCCYSTNVAKGTVSTIVSPAIAVGGQQAYFNFSVYHYSGTFATEDSLTPCAIDAYGSVQTLGDPIMRDNGTTGWKEYSYPLSGNVVCVALKGYSDYGYNIHVDRIAVSTEQSGVSAVEIADNALVTVYNLSGARVAERMQRSDVSTLAPGCYIVRSATATEKVIVR